VLKYRTKRELKAAYDEHVQVLDAAMRYAETCPPNMIAWSQLRCEGASADLRHWVNVHAILMSVLPD
jgi:hypothetical protein